ncbi:MAG: M23 family metallopeptidase [Proteobacteria bacterium]|nr:M23 family metallopeptidase [Pseudomonadota bacterium]
MPDVAAAPTPVTDAGEVRSAAAVGRSASGDDLGVGPVARPLPGAVGSRYGNRVHPVHGGVKMHHGADIGAATGTPIHAFAAGTVTFAGSRGGYGNMVEVDHGNGYVTRYAHNSRLLHKVGTLVRAGQEIAKAGSTGRSTGPHVHFEVWQNGRAVNPNKLLTAQSPLRG